RQGCKFEVVGAWLSRPGRSFPDPTQNGRCQSQESKHFGKKGNSPARPIISEYAARAEKCCCQRPEEYCKKRILGEGPYIIQAGNAVEEISESERGNEHLDRIRGNKPCNRSNWHAHLQIVEHKTCKRSEHTGWPNSRRYQDQYRNQNCAIWPKGPCCLGIQHQSTFQFWSKIG